MLLASKALNRSHLLTLALAFAQPWKGSHCQECLLSLGLSEEVPQEAKEIVTRSGSRGRYGHVIMRGHVQDLTSPRGPNCRSSRFKVTRLFHQAS